MLVSARASFMVRSACYWCGYPIRPACGTCGDKPGHGECCRGVYSISGRIFYIYRAAPGPGGRVIVLNGEDHVYIGLCAVLHLVDAQARCKSRAPDRNRCGCRVVGFDAFSDDVFRIDFDEDRLCAGQTDCLEGRLHGCRLAEAEDRVDRLGEGFGLTWGCG